MATLDQYSDKIPPKKSSTSQTMTQDFLRDQIQRIDDRTENLVKDIKLAQRRLDGLLSERETNAAAREQYLKAIANLDNIDKGWLSLGVGELQIDDTPQLGKSTIWIRKSDPVTDFVENRGDNDDDSLDSW